MVYGFVNESLLAADADRERVVDVLRAGFAEGRLSQDEFNERVAQTYASRTYGDLRELTADLPAGPVPAGGLAAGILPAGITGPLMAQHRAGVRPGASIAGLVLTAIVVFTLAAVVTAIAVFLHVHGQAFERPYGPYGQFGPGQINLMPAVQHLQSP